MTFDLEQHQSLRAGRVALRKRLQRAANLFQRREAYRPRRAAPPFAPRLRAQDLAAPDGVAVVELRREGAQDEAIAGQKQQRLVELNLRQPAFARLEFVVQEQRHIAQALRADRVKQKPAALRQSLARHRQIG